MPQTAHGHDVYPVISAIAKLGAGEDHQKGGFPHFVYIDFIAQLFQMFGRFFNLFCPHFYLNRAPSPVFQMDYRVGLKPVFIAVMKDLAVNGAGVYPQIPDAERFKK